MDPKTLTYARIDIRRLEENFMAVKKLVGEDTAIMSIVKADAYGHGAVEIAKALSKAGTDSFGVANMNEAFEIRIRAGVINDVVVLSSIDKYSAAEIVKYRFMPVVYDLKSLKLFDREAGKAKKTVRVHMKFDTSMGRLGFFPQDAERIFKAALRLGNIKIEGIMSHLSSADEDDQSYSREQISRFEEILRVAKGLGIDPRYKHIANSAGIINMKESHYNMVRPGIMLYGSNPSSDTRHRVKLKPVMSVYSKVLQVKEFPKGASISYSRTYTTKRQSRIAVLPLGYADGFSRLLSNRAYVLLHGKKAPVVGNVTMDMTMVDVTDIPETKVSDTATIIGGGIDAWDLAELAGTISYEIFTGISKRVKRHYTY